MMFRTGHLLLFLSVFSSLLFGVESAAYPEEPEIDDKFAGAELTHDVEDVHMQEMLRQSLTPRAMAAFEAKLASTPFELWWHAIVEEMDDSAQVIVDGPFDLPGKRGRTKRLTLTKAEFAFWFRVVTSGFEGSVSTYLRDAQTPIPTPGTYGWHTHRFITDVRAATQAGTISATVPFSFEAMWVVDARLGLKPRQRHAPFINSLTFAANATLPPLIDAYMRKHGAYPATRLFHALVRAPVPLSSLPGLLDAVLAPSSYVGPVAGGLTPTARIIAAAVRDIAKGVVPGAGVEAPSTPRGAVKDSNVCGGNDGVHGGDGGADCGTDHIGGAVGAAEWADGYVPRSVAAAAAAVIDIDNASTVPPWAHKQALLAQVRSGVRGVQSLIRQQLEANGLDIGQREVFIAVRPTHTYAADELTGAKVNWLAHEDNLGEAPPSSIHAAYGWTSIQEAIRLDHSIPYMVSGMGRDSRNQQFSETHAAPGGAPQVSVGLRTAVTADFNYEIVLAVPPKPLSPEEAAVKTTKFSDDDEEDDDEFVMFEGESEEDMEQRRRRAKESKNELTIATGSCHVSVVPTALSLFNDPSIYFDFAVGRLFESELRCREVRKAAAHAEQRAREQHEEAIAAGDIPAGTPMPPVEVREDADKCGDVVVKLAQTLMTQSDAIDYEAVPPTQGSHVKVPRKAKRRKVDFPIPASAFRGKNALSVGGKGKATSAEDGEKGTYGSTKSKVKKRVYFDAEGYDLPTYTRQEMSVLLGWEEEPLAVWEWAANATAVLRQKLRQQEQELLTRRSTVQDRLNGRFTGLTGALRGLSVFCEPDQA